VYHGAVNTYHAIILGIIEGLTEFLPISSTGHMILVSHFLRINDSATLDTFEIVVQLGAILAVVVVYYKKLFQVEMIKKLIIGFIPTGIVGVIVYPQIKNLLTGPNSAIIVASMLIIGGIIILLVERKYEKETEEGKIVEISSISYTNAIILGLFQALAIIPGVSRSGAMIVGGLWRRLSRKLLVEFTFLLAVPTMTVATLYTLVKKHNELSLESVSPIIIGTVISFVIALLVIKFFLQYIRRHSFNIFGWYRIIVGVILLIILLTTRD
jgi:undecaprenyl-diphosphatase